MLQFKRAFSILIRLCILCKNRSYFIQFSRGIKNLCTSTIDSVMRLPFNSGIFRSSWDMRYSMIYCCYCPHQKDMCLTPLHKCPQNLRLNDRKVHWDCLYWKEEFNRTLAHCQSRKSSNKYGWYSHLYMTCQKLGYWYWGVLYMTLSNLCHLIYCSISCFIAMFMRQDILCIRKYFVV